MKHKPQISANTQCCCQHYITHPPVSQSFRFQLFYLNTKNTGGTLNNYISFSGTIQLKCDGTR